MLLLITERKSISQSLTDTFRKNGIFFFRSSLKNAAACCKWKDTGGILLDCTLDAQRAVKLCAFLRKRYPEMPIATIVPMKKPLDLPSDCIIRDGDTDRICEEALAFCMNNGWSPEELSTYYLTLARDPRETVYMGYAFPLSEVEHRILRCLFYRSPRWTSTKDLMALCYPRERRTLSNLAVQIHKINKLALTIDPRPLIVNVYSVGYRLRDGILTECDTGST